MAGETAETKAYARGGAQFPNHDLEACVAWAERLVSKTHVSSQPKDVIYAAVVEAKGWRGRAKVSSMKQFGLAEDDGENILASKLAKTIMRTPEEDRKELLQQAALTPKLFAAVFSTFHGDKVSPARIRQRFLELDVHPEKVEKCVEFYTSSFVYAELASLDGDAVVHQLESERPSVDVEASDTVEPDVEVTTETEEVVDPIPDNKSEVIAEYPIRGRSGVEIRIQIDSTLDAEKLKQHLKLLKKYGAI